MCNFTDIILRLIKYDEIRSSVSDSVEKNSISCKIIIYLHIHYLKEIQLKFFVFQVGPLTPYLVSKLPDQVPNLPFKKKSL